MKNIILLNNLVIDLDNIEYLLNKTNNKTFKIYNVHIDEFTKNIIILTNYAIYVFSIIGDNNEDLSNFTFSNKNLINQIEFNKNTLDILSKVKSLNDIKLFLFKNEDNSFYILLSSGEFITNYDNTLMISTSNKQIIRIINEIDEQSTIVCAKLSPNLEHIILIYDNYTILHLNYDFEIINQCELDDGEGTSDIVKDKLKEADLSFKGDSEYFVVHYKIGNGSKCLVRDLKLNIIKGPAKADNKVIYSVAEGVISNYQIPIAWQPFGSNFGLFNLLLNSIHFAEKNCLRHGELNIKNLTKNSNDTQECKFLINDLNIVTRVKQMLFSREHTILILGLNYYCKISNNFVCSQVMFFYRSNYNWSLKYSKYFDSIDAFNNKNFEINCIKSSEINPLKYYILLENNNSIKSLYVIDFKLDYILSLTNNNTDNDSCTIISQCSNILKFTPLMYGVIPPPMCLKELEIDNKLPFLITTYLNRYYVLSETGLSIIQNIKNEYKLLVNIKHNSFKNVKCPKFFIVLEETDINSKCMSNNTDIQLNSNSTIPNSVYLFVVSLGINNNFKEEPNDLLNIININNLNSDTKLDKNIKTISIICNKVFGLFNSLSNNNIIDKKYFRNKKPRDFQQQENKLENTNYLNKADMLIKNLNSNSCASKDFLSSDIFNKIDKNVSKDSPILDLNDSKSLYNNFNMNEEYMNYKENSIYDNKKKRQEDSFYIIMNSENNTKDIIKVNFNLHELNFNNSNEDNKHESFNSCFNNKEIVFNCMSNPIKVKTTFIGYDDFNEYVIILNKNKKLIINDVTVASEITSFEIYKNFLIMTQSSNSSYSTLHLINLNDKEFTDNLEANTFNNKYIPDFNSKSIYIRTIERGSLIVGITKETVVLQAPRGNLESFNPRLLVLFNIKELILNNNYSEAFNSIRKQKINMNFLYDIDPESFIRNSDLIISQINNPNYLNLLINSLLNELSDEANQTGGNMYSSQGKIVSLKTEEFCSRYINNKINMVCNAFLTSLGIDSSNHEKSVYNSKYITTILQLYTKLQPPKYFEALTLLRNCDSLHADQGLEYLCWIVNSNIIYDFALKTYDFELIIMVAKKTQKDPKEYLPYLEKLKNMDPCYMKFTINYDLKDYKSAVIELSLGGNQYFLKVIELIQKFNLYDSIKFLYTKKEHLELRKKLFSLYSINLFNNNKYIEAASAALKSCNEDLAIMCYIKNADFYRFINTIMLNSNKFICGKNNVLKIYNYIDNNISVNDFINSTINNTKSNSNKNNKHDNIQEFKLENIIVDIINYSVSFKKYDELDKILLYFDNICNNKHNNESNLEILKLITCSSEKNELNNNFFLTNIYTRVLEAYCILKKWNNAYFMSCKYTNNIYRKDIKINTQLPVISDTNNETTNLEEILYHKIKFEANLIKNEITSIIKDFNEKLNRLLIVQSEKKQDPNLLEKFNQDIYLEDNFSETGSVISSNSSHNSHKSNISSKTKKSNISKLTKKAKNKLNKRNIKQGSPLEEDYLLIVLHELREKYKNVNYENEIKDLCYVLTLFELTNQSSEIAELYELFTNKLNKSYPLYNAYQQEFINKYPDIKMLFNNLANSNNYDSLTSKLDNTKNNNK